MKPAGPSSLLYVLARLARTRCFILPEELTKRSKWFEPRSISSSYCVIVRVKVVLKRTVVGD